MAKYFRYVLCQFRKQQWKCKSVYNTFRTVKSNWTIFFFHCVRPRRTIVPSLTFSSRWAFTFGITEVTRSAIWTLRFHPQFSFIRERPPRTKFRQMATCGAITAWWALFLLRRCRKLRTIEPWLAWPCFVCPAWILAEITFRTWCAGRRVRQT